MQETDMEKSKRNLRIVYMGTPDFAVAGLRLLLNEGYEIVGVITAPDRPAGRGQKVRESAVKQFSKKHDLKILQPTNLKDVLFIEELKSLKANLQIVVAFRMLPKVVWQMPEYGTFNLHASLLPQYRGAAPINWAIINGEEETGVTTFFIDEKIDTGQVILQEKIEIDSNENAGHLHDKLMHLGARVILETVQLIKEDNVILTKQSEGEDLKTANKIHKDTCRIDWNLPINDIFNHIRGLSPYPTAWTVLINGEKEIPVKIYEAEMIVEEHNHKSGQVHSSKKELKVSVEGGFLDLKVVQLAGKKKMEIVAILNGMSVDESALFQ